MPAIAAISVNDAKATPVAHVFTPTTTNGSKAKWDNRAASIPSGNESLTWEVREPTSATGAYRIIGKLTKPTVAAVNGVDQVVRVSTANFDINYSQSDTLQDRKDMLALLANLFAHASVKASNEGPEPFY